MALLPEGCASGVGAEDAAAGSSCSLDGSRAVQRGALDKSAALPTTQASRPMPGENRLPLTIGVRELKNHASRVIRAVREEMAE